MEDKEDGKLKRERAWALLYKACTNDDQLHTWLKAYLGIDVPRTNVCPHHCAPFDYVRAAYFEPATDLVVWAPRGGGKTRLGAATTLLDLLHKPGVKVRILGGSLEQSCKMWEHLTPDVQRVAAALLDKKSIRSREVSLANGSSAGVLAQSQKAVRGLRVQKLRCDEVELFDPKVWEASQMTTRSLTQTNGACVANGVVEAISTFHKPWGLMSKVIKSAADSGKRLLHWCIFEVMERCPESRACETCPLFADCQGIAKTKCSGFFSIDDVITIKRRLSRDCWESEMMCRRPSVVGAVFPHFNEEKHVKDFSVTAQAREANRGELRLAIDFGFNNPFVCLWVMSYENGPNQIVHVVDEYVQEARMLHEHITEIESRSRWPRATIITCDPAGNGRNDQTAESNIAFLKRRGYTVKARGSRIVDGIEKIRFGLQPAAGDPTLFIAPGCTKLIESLRGYHYAEGGSELPLKDGHDHCVDALRYFYVNRTTGLARWRKY